MDTIYDTLTNELTRRAMYVYRNIKAHSCNHYCSGKAISTKYSKCVSVALLIKHAMRMRHIVICGLPGSTMYFYDIPNSTIFKKKKSYLT